MKDRKGSYHRAFYFCLILIFLVLATAACSDSNITVQPPTITVFDREPTCVLTGGEIVNTGWSGDDTGDNYCNQCMCGDVGLVCTEMACQAVAPLPTLTPLQTYTPLPTYTSVPTPTPVESDTCTLSGGGVVRKRWSGKDTGDNYCNQCMCTGVGLVCTKMACMKLTPVKELVVITLTKEPTVEKRPVLTVVIPATPTAIPKVVPTPTPIPTATITRTNVPEDNKVISEPNDSRFLITTELCGDEDGPDCANLRLGDDYLTVSTPNKGYLYSCSDKNPGAPGSNESKITWINFVNKTWNFLAKLWLPEGQFDPGKGNFTEIVSDDIRKISINNLPVDGKIGDWPMTQYSRLTDIDGNPGIPLANGMTFTYPITPLETMSPSCVALGPIGVTKNGVVIYNAADGRGEDAVAREIVDVFGGHPARDEYHYHFIPERLDNETLSDGHSGIVGYINDGYPIYGYKGLEGKEMTNDELDMCHGHTHGNLGYHYHATLEYPYTIGCYIGTPISVDFSNPGQSGGQRPPRRR